MMAAIRDLTQDLGRRAQLFVDDLGGMSLLAGRTVYEAVTPPYGVKLLVDPASLDMLNGSEIDFQEFQEV